MCLSMHTIVYSELDPLSHTGEVGDGVKGKERESLPLQTLDHAGKGEGVHLISFQNWPNQEALVEEIKAR